MNQTDKQQVRAHFKLLRAAVPADERARIDAAIAKQTCSLPEFAEADLVLPYLAFGAEVETRGVVEEAWRQGKQVALPRCVDGTRLMEWYAVDNYDGLVKSSIGVEEPPANPARIIDPAAYRQPLCLVPGLSFDDRGYRLGYGGGFYDTFLADFTGVAAGLCRELQRSSRLSCLDPHDLPVQIVVTETNTLRIA